MSGRHQSDRSSARICAADAWHVGCSFLPAVAQRRRAGHRTSQLKSSDLRGVRHDGFSSSTSARLTYQLRTAMRTLAWRCPPRPRLQGFKVSRFQGSGVRLWQNLAHVCHAEAGDHADRVRSRQATRSCRRRQDDVRTLRRRDVPHARGLALSGLPFQDRLLRLVTRPPPGAMTPTLRPESQISLC